MIDLKPLETNYKLSPSRALIVTHVPKTWRWNRSFSKVSNKIKTIIYKVSSYTLEKIFHIFHQIYRSILLWYNVIQSLFSNYDQCSFRCSRELSLSWCYLILVSSNMKLRNKNCGKRKEKRERIRKKRRYSRRHLYASTMFYQVEQTHNTREASLNFPLSKEGKKEK